MHINKDCVTECGRILPNCTKFSNSYVTLLGLVFLLYQFHEADERVGRN